MNPLDEPPRDRLYIGDLAADRIEARSETADGMLVLTVMDDEYRLEISAPASQVEQAALGCERLAAALLAHAELLRRRVS
jgi:hypothetical protein